jgi:hypothetical protein
MKRLIACLAIGFFVALAPAISFAEHHEGANPCAMKENPCAAKKAANPCAAKKAANPCNPCGPAKANPCNPCAAKANPCDHKGHK